MKKNQSGNVLFLILIAVALFAALSYAVTSSNRSGKTSITSESGELAASRILNFTTAVQGAVLRLSTVKGVTPPELKYNNDVSTSYDGSTYVHGAMGTPSDPSLYVFHPLGGNIPAQKFEDAVTPCSGCGGTPVKGGHFAISWMRMVEAGTNDLAELAVMIGDLREDACLAINKKLGIDFIPNVNWNGGGGYVQDSVTSPSWLPIMTGNTAADTTAITGKPTICLKKTNPPIRYMYLSIIKAY